jgi:hypothetical protein
MYLPNMGNFRIRAPFSLLFQKEILFSLTQRPKEIEVSSKSIKSATNLDAKFCIHDDDV